MILTTGNTLITCAKREEHFALWLPQKRRIRVYVGNTTLVTMTERKLVQIHLAKNELVQIHGAYMVIIK